MGEGKANAEQLQALEVITDADEKAEAKMRKKEKLMHQVTEIKAKAAKAKFKVEQVKENTAKAQDSAREKTSKADVLKGLRKRAEAQVDSQEADFELQTMANKIRSVKAGHEAANKQTTTAAHTLKVMQ